MQQKLIVGVDVSKETLDIHLRPLDVSLQVSNCLEGFRELYKCLPRNKGYEILVIMEHTGHYSLLFEKFLASKAIGFCKESALQIKRSIGVTRGKNDRVDARRIAEYGWQKREDLKPEAPVGAELQLLQDLLSLRRKIVKDCAGYKSRLKELKACGVLPAGQLLMQSHQATIDHFFQQIQVIDQEIKKVVKGSADLKKNYELLISIKGVGPIVAAHTLAVTKNFQKFSNARKFNCYAGLAPFAYQSGSSIKGKARVSHLANKETKTLMNLSAFNAIQFDAELRSYYQKRLAAGMAKMSCLNVIRCKIVARMFAVIKRQTPFVPIAA